MEYLASRYCRRMEWVTVIPFDELQPGQIVTVERDAGDLVVWMSQAGELSACDARCPHQWAHLGSAGAVDGEELVCLSHFWRFDCEGVGSKLSANGRRDEKSPIATHRVRVREGCIEVECPEEP